MQSRLSRAVRPEGSVRHATTKKQNSITDAVEILHRRYFAGKPEMGAMLEEARAEEVVVCKITDLRTKAGLSQRELAKLVGTSSSAICRLEDADYEGHSMSMLKRIANVLNTGLEIRFVPLPREPKLKNAT